MYFKRPKEANILSGPLNIEVATVATDITTTETSSVIISWNGVGDSNRMELVFLPTGYTDAYTVNPTDYEGLDFDDDSTIIEVPARTNVGDNYVYTIQSNLEPDTYYWWKIRNYRNKMSMFGFNIEVFSSSEPRIFKTGSYSDDGAGEGEIPEDPTPPKPPRNQPQVEG